MTVERFIGFACGAAAGSRFASSSALNRTKRDPNRMHDCVFKYFSMCRELVPRSGLNTIMTRTKKKNGASLVASRG
jgi:hypothetical protein